MKEALVVGGSSGIGLAVALQLANDCNVTVIDKQKPCVELPDNVSYVQFDLCTNDYSVFDSFQNIDRLVITAGFGKVTLFENYSERELTEMMNVNATGVMRVIQHFYKKMQSSEDFYCAVMVSIAGFMSSPYLAVYGASKAALKIFIESLNVELLKGGTTNQILNVSPGSLKGTAFDGGKTDLSLLSSFANELVERMMKKEDLWIPKYDEVYRNVLARYVADFRAEGAHSYDYKKNSGRVK